VTITVIGVENLNVSSWDLNKNVLDSIEYKSTIFFFLVSREQIIVALRIIVQKKKFHLLLLVSSGTWILHKVKE